MLNKDRLSCVYESLPFAMDAIGYVEVPDRLTDIRDFGGVGDGVTLNTDAFKNAMEFLASQGGGHLVVPEGVWLTGPIELKSNIDLHITRQAIILFSSDKNLYPIVDTVFEGLDTKRCMPLLSAVGAENFSVTGGGILDGSGDSWRQVRKSRTTDAEWNRIVESGGFLDKEQEVWYPDESYFKGAKMCGVSNVPRNLTEDSEWEEVRTYLRPVMVGFIHCNRILIEDVQFQNSPCWTVHPLMCKDVVVRGITVRNPWYAKNSDGIDVDSCEGVAVLDSTFDVGNDAICIKSGRDEDGRRRARPSRNVIVDGCTVFHGYGGFVIGSEMSGGVSNISVSRCRFIGTDAGLRFKSCIGRGGVVENVYVNDVVMQDIQTEPLLFDMYYRRKYSCATGADAVPVFRHFYFRNITCRGAFRAIYMNGLPDSDNLSDMLFENFIITCRRGADMRHVTGLELRNVQIFQSEGESVIYTDCENVVAKMLEDSYL